MKVNKYFPFAFIYFFLNSLALPFGLTYTALLAPVFYVWILLVRKKEILLPFLGILLPFVIIHLIIVGVDEKNYFLSLLNILLVYVFCQAVYTFLLVCKDITTVFRWILIINFVCCLIAIPLYFSGFSGVWWVDQVMFEGGGRSRRLKLFTYEPSYYALLFTPVFLYFLLGYLFRQNTIRGPLLLIMLFLPYILSFSVGVITAVILSGILTWILYFRRLTRKRRILNGLVYTGTLLGASIFTLAMFFRHNPVFGRISNILGGKDSSGKGRTSDAFILASRLLHEKNEYWGVGIGQVKIMGEEIIRSYYLYLNDFTVRIPNAAADTLAVFGWVGFCLRLGIEIFLFFHTRVWTNYYRLLLFFFIFIYQFTGSFITNVAEYVIWIFAFTNVFHQFDVKGDKDKLPQPAGA